MARTPRSLWSLVPPRVRWSLLPLFTSAILVGAGKELALKLTEALEGKLSVSAAGDVAAFLLLCNVLLVLWVFEKVLSLEIENDPESIDLPSRFMIFAAIFVSIVDLFKLAATEEQEDYIALYGLVVVFYLLIVPFLLVVVRDGPAEPPDSADAGLLRSFLRMAARTAVYGVTMSAAVTACVGMFFAIMTDGWQIAYPTTRPIGDWFGQQERNNFWMINPMLLAVPTLQLCTIRFGEIWTNADESHPLVIPDWRHRLLVAVSIAMILLLAVVMLSDEEMLQEGAQAVPPFNVEAWMRAAQGVVGMLYWAIFIGAFFASRALMEKMSEKLVGRVPGWAAGLCLFTVAGVAAGSVVVGARAIISGSLAPVQFNLLWLHGVCFALGFLGIRLGSLVLAGRIEGMRPLLPFGEARR